MDLYKTGMLVAMFLCVRGIDLCIYGPVQDRNVSGHVFVCQGDRSLYLWLVAMFLCVRGFDLCISVQDRNVSGHVFVCQGDRLYLWTCTRQEC